ncbi:MAG: Holliday junction resolvase RuvX [Methylophilaceae bacterium]|nr:Holliday junction resolvase RuvX [Methylophilaceae bacterium]
MQIPSDDIAALPVVSSNPSAKLICGVLAFDFGEKRIGVASGEHLLGIAHPLTTINAAANEERFRIIAELIAEWRPGLLVVGLPLSVEGEEHALTLLAKKFSRRLDGRFGLPVVMVDERYTSVEASRTLKQMGISGRKQKTMLDAVAAQHILQSYFDALP